MQAKLQEKEAERLRVQQEIESMKSVCLVGTTHSLWYLNHGNDTAEA